MDALVLAPLARAFSSTVLGMDEPGQTGDLHVLQRTFDEQLKAVQTYFTLLLKPLVSEANANPRSITSLITAIRQADVADAPESLNGQHILTH